MVDWGDLVVDAYGTFEEGPVCIMDSWGSSFAKQDHEASEGVVVAPWNRGGNMGARKYYACQLPFLVQGRRYVLVIHIK